jgi:hypothetical protein
MRKFPDMVTVAAVVLTLALPVAALAQQDGPNYPRPIDPNNPVAGNSGCDDMQQERICTVNDGTIVISGGCEKCLAP